MTATRETATQLDAAIDSLLEHRGRLRSVDEGELVATARLLREVLPRFHPRFGFEELLSHRLAARRRPDWSAPADVVALGPEQPPAPDVDGPADAGESAHADMATSGDRRRRGLVAGGAIASGVSLVIPIAGAALVVWRRSRSSGGIL